MSVRQAIGAVLSIGAVIVAAALILVVAIVAYLSVGPPQVDVARRAFPSGVELGESLHQENVSGFREGCVLVIFRLSDESARSLQADAASYLHG